MNEFLNTRQVQELLQIDRITVYRMLQDGRLKGVKIGQQWRFNRSEVEALTNGRMPTAGNECPLPTHCLQTIQDLFAEVGQISAQTIDLQGRLLTNISSPCALCRLVHSTAAGKKACERSWQMAVNQVVQPNSKSAIFFECIIGLQYIGAPLFDTGRKVGWFLAGPFLWQTSELEQELNQLNERLRRLAPALNLSPAEMQAAVPSIPVIHPERRAQVEAWPVAAARAVHSIFQERTGFVDRLQQIANLTQLS